MIQKGFHLNYSECVKFYYVLSTSISSPCHLKEKKNLKLLNKAAEIFEDLLNSLLG